jgi:hypothetical protein
MLVRCDRPVEFVRLTTSRQRLQSASADAIMSRRG